MDSPLRHVMAIRCRDGLPPSRTTRSHLWHIEPRGRLASDCDLDRAPFDHIVIHCAESSPWNCSLFAGCAADEERACDTGSNAGPWKDEETEHGEAEEGPFP
jgi:hypothetical protein